MKMSDIARPAAAKLTASLHGTKQEVNVVLALKVCYTDHAMRAAAGAQATDERRAGSMGSRLSGGPTRMRRRTS